MVAGYATRDTYHGLRAVAYRTETFDWYKPSHNALLKYLFGRVP